MPGPSIAGSLPSSWSWRRKERVKSVSLGSRVPLCPVAGSQAGLARALACGAELGEGAVLTSPSEGVWTGQPLGTSCNNLSP